MTMKLEHLLLGVLLEAPSNGYGLKRYFDTHGRFLRSRTQMSQVYRSLAAMEDRGWVEHEIDPRPGAQDAKVYRVTESGSVVFLDWLTGPYQPPARFEDPEFSARIAFAGLMSVDDLLRLIDDELHARIEQRARFRFRDRSQTWAPTVDFDAELQTLVGEWAHRRGSAAMDAHIEGLQSLRAELLDREAPAPRTADDLEETHR